MTFDEPKAGSAEKIQNDYSPKQFVSTEVLRVSQFEKTHNQTNADDGSCVCSYPEVRSVHTNKINANVTGKQKQTRPIQAGGSVCDSGTEIRQSSEISFRLSSGCSITFERKWGNQNRLIENENNDPGSENKASAEQELIIDRNTGGAIQKKEKFNSVELSVECSGESDRSKATNVVQYGSYRPLQHGLSSSDSNVVLEQERTKPRGGLPGTAVTIAERGGANTNCQLRSESPSKLNNDDSRKCSGDKSYQDIKQLQVSQVIERVSQPISRPLSDKTSLKYIDAPESDCVNDLYGIDTSALTFTELSSVLSDNFNVTRETKCNKQSYEYGSDGAIMTCGRPSDDGHIHHWTQSGHSEPATPRTTHDHNTRVKEVNKQGHSKLTIKANTADKSAKMADNRGLSPGVKPKIKSRGVLYQNTHTFDLVASKLDRRPGIRENTPVIDHDLKINSWDSTSNDYNKQGVDREGLDPRDRHSDKPLFNDTRQTIQQVSKHDSKYQGSRDLHVFQSRDNPAYGHITLNTRTANQIPKGGDSNKTSDHIANETSGLLKGPDTDNKFNNGTYNADCVSRSSLPEKDTIPVTTHNFCLPGNSPGEEICTNLVNGRNDARGGDLTHGLMNGNEKTGQDNEAVDRNMRYNDIPVQPVTAIATSTAVARQEIESDSLGRPGSPLRRPVVSAVASAEASGLNPFFAVARATAHAASIASANATSGVATTRGHAMVPSDVTVVMSTSCTLNAASDQNILQDASDVSGAMIGSDVMKVSVRSASASPFGAGGSSSANSLPVTKADNTNASYRDRRSPYENAMQNTRDEYEQSHASNDASVQTVRTYLPRSVSPTKRLGPMERHILRDDSFNRRLKTPDRLLSPEASPSASPTRALKANIPSWYKEMHYRPSRNDDDDDECDHVKGNLDSKRHHSPVKMRSSSPKDSQRKHTILNTTNDFITGGVPEVPLHAENAPPRPPPPKNYNTAPSRPEKTYIRNTGSVSSLDSVNQQKRPQPPPKTYKSVLQEPVSAPASPAQPYYHDTNDSRPDVLVPPSKMKSKVSRQLFLRDSPQNQELSGAASESAKSRFERESHHKDKAHVPVPKVEDMDLPGINSGANKTSPALDLKEKLRKARPKSLTVSRNDIDQAIAEAKAKSLQRASKTKSMDNIYMCHAGPHTHPSKFFTERASTPCLLETDLDTGKETRTLLYQETNLDEVLSPISKAKSMMELTSSRRSNKLEKGSNDVPLSDGDLSSDQRSQSTYGLRVSKSLQKLTVPDWYKASPVSHKPKEGVYLKNANSAGDIFSPSPRPVVSPPAKSRQQLGSRPVITPCRVTPPLSVSSNKSSPTTPTSQLSTTKFELPSAKFRQSPSELKRIENRWGSGSPTGSMSVVPKTKQSPTSNGPGTNGQQEEDGQQEPTYDPVINEICAQIDAITAQTQGNSPTEGKPLPPKPEVNMQLAFEAVQRFFTPPQSPARPFDTAGTLSKESSLADLYYYTPPVERRTTEWDAPEPTGRHSRNLSSHAGRSTPATMASSRPSSAMSAFGRASGNHTPFPILQFAEAQGNESPRESSTPKPLRHNDLEVTFTETNLDDSDEEWDGGLAEDVFEDSLENASMEEVLNGLLSLPNDTQSPTRAQADSLEGGPEKTGVQNFMTSALQESPMSSMLSLDASGTSVDLSMFSLNMSADSTQSIHYLEEEIPPEKTSTEVVDDEKVLVKCRYPQCCKVQVLKEARKSYKTCHHCYTYYCSRQCRKMHWDSHKKRCLYSRVSSVCKNVIKKINKDQDLLYHVSRVARTGYLSRGRGYVHIYFDTPDAASEMLEKGMDYPPELKYVSVKELENQLDNEKLSELHAFAKKYNPEFKFVVHVCILAAKEIPVKPTPRLAGPLIHKCAKLRLSAAHIKTKPGAKEEQETLILTAVPGAHELEELGPQKAREVCFINIQRKVRQRGVSLRHMYPTVYNQVCDYVANNEEFAPILILPYDGNTGKRFMCIIMPKSDPEMDWLEAKRLMKDLDLSMDARDNNVNAATVAASAEVNGSSIPSR
ncbi:uncharacterized protein LOC106179478 [Lingula anatina]|uniref:Uncharacterized protein LOC106179478 n=1 Tax=Lingula anatina TaxID=7574 RepID=A0A1S3K7H0_LINAN|nr:uncharacterized protein LOC106179478 [Lingula anatina]|eukprot:XP_013418575.1 uncharacterized protein LOC106179478 [Lingula anatina]